MEKRGASNFGENVIEVKRVSKKNEGGNRISFTALVIVGDRNGTIGYSHARALNVNDAIQKAVAKARKNSVKINLVNNTLPYDIFIKKGACKIYVKPSPEGTGLVAGGAVRQVLDLAGVKNASAKILGTSNKNANVEAVFEALKALKEIKVKVSKNEIK